MGMADLGLVGLQNPWNDWRKYMHKFNNSSHLLQLQNAIQFVKYNTK